MVKNIFKIVVSKNGCVFLVIFSCQELIVMGRMETDELIRKFDQAILEVNSFNLVWSNASSVSL